MINQLTKLCMLSGFGHVVYKSIHVDELKYDKMGSEFMNGFVAPIHFTSFHVSTFLKENYEDRFRKLN